MLFHFSIVEEHDERRITYGQQLYEMIVYDLIS